jgi:hypothetical protein
MRMALAFAFLAATGCAALAGDSEPAIVIPSRPGVPVIINGRDVSYAVLEGDWGLGKGVHVQPTAYPTNWRPILKPPAAHYYPHTGQAPGYGRLEIDTPAQNLPQAESYYRSYTMESQPTLPTPPSAAVPFDPPPIILAPRDHRDGADGHRAPVRPGRHGP